MVLIFIALAAFGSGRYFKFDGESSGGYRTVPPEGELDTKILTIGSFEVEVEVASTPPEKSRGLSGRESLPIGRGMLFVFEGPRRYSFWMKDMLFPIDIIWIGENKEIVDITYDARPESYPLHFQPRYPAQYVLEVKSGWAQSRGIQVGDDVEFSL